MPRGLHKETREGFTILEVLLAIAVISILAVFAVPVSHVFQVKNDLEIAVNTVSQTLRRAQTLAESVAGDASWGVFVTATSATLFQGSSFSGRVTSSDEVFGFSGTVQPSGLQEFVFLKFSGEPQTTGTLMLTSPVNATRSVGVIEKGLIQY